jgi:signal transduction histidine kinase
MAGYEGVKTTDRSGAQWSAGPAVAWLGVPLVTAIAVAGARPVWSIWPLTGTAAIVTSSAWAAIAALLAAERGKRSMALFFFLVGLGWAGEWLDNLNRGPFPFLAYMSGPLYVACGAIALLMYTAGRRLSRAERGFAVVIAGWLMVGRLAMAVTSEPGRFHYPVRAFWPTITTAPGRYEFVSIAYWTGAALLAVGFLSLIRLAVRRAAHLDRWTLTPLVVASVLTVGTIAVRIPWRLIAPSATTPTPLVAGQTIGLLLVPIGFLVSAIRGRLAPASVADLVIRVVGRVTAEELRDALRTTLRDPTLDVCYRVHRTERYVDAGGRDVDLSDVARGRTVFDVASSDGTSMAAVVTSPALAAHRRLLDAALSTSRLALENSHLAATAAAHLDEIRTVHRAVVEAGDAERRRIEQDLHDGLQQRLVALTLRLAAGSGGVVDPATRNLLDQARAELRATLRDLRDLAHGVYPAVLTDGGLRPAVSDLAERMPLPIAIDVPASRWPPVVEATAYFVIAEALTNAVKHAAATSARVRVSVEGPCLRILVADDGRGGADATAGKGLSGLLDRVRSLDGDVRVGGEHGTEISAVIPLAPPAGGRPKPDQPTQLGS